MGDFDLMVGAYYVNEELDVLDGIRVGSDYQTYVNALLLVSGEATLPPGSFVDGQGAQVDSFQQDTDSWALFTHNTWNVTDRLGLTLGLRYTDETKDVKGTLIADNPACLAVAAGNPAGLGPVGRSLVCLPLISPLVDAPNNALLGNVGPYQGSRSDNEWTGTLVGDYQFSEEWLGYASYSRGYKAGGYNLDRAGFNNPNPVQGIFPSTMDLEFSPETVDSYELGAKATLADGRLRVNLAAFYAEFQDFQLNTFTGTNFIVTNLDKVESKGVELETTAFITDGLTLTGGVTYNDARYGDNVSDPTLAGKQLTNAPEWVVTAATDYEWPIADKLLGYTHLDFRFTGEHNTGSNLAPEKRQAGAAVWNGAVGVAGDERSWEVELWVRNLFDRDYRQVVFDAPLQNGSYNAFLGDPRVWGVRGRINF
jgi:outer membrane receptor protein involved in Fe transport